MGARTPSVFEVQRGPGDFYWRCRLVQSRLFPKMRPEHGLAFLTDEQWAEVYSAAIALEEGRAL